MPTFTPIVPYEIAEVIRLKKSQYCQFADTHDWAGFDNIFLPSLQASFHAPGGEVLVEHGVTFSFEGREAFVGFFAKAFETQQTIHVVGPGELSLVAGDEVRAVWPATYHAASLGSKGGWRGTGGGYYREVWKKVDGDWFMASLKFERWFWRVQEELEA